MNEGYKKQVALLIRIMPSVYRIKEFAVHGGSAINLFHKNMPRYSIDIDLTYLPLKGREQSLEEINLRLLELGQYIEKSVSGIRVTPKLAVWKLLCVKDGAIVKIEVNGTKRGVICDTEDKMLCSKAEQEFNMTCMARIVPFTQLYGGKIAAALSRQHPRDLFDCRYMEAESFDIVKNGLMFCLLGSDKPIIESLQPNPVNRQEALDNQFEGMSDIPFTYSDFEETHKNLIEKVNGILTDNDKEFIVSFEQGEPAWSKCCAGDLSSYPSVKWKLQNILKLKEINPEKHRLGIERLSSYLSSVR
ncbi:MAG: nucleotidyl transferase AbiEii/AbiGii toxin family protein [Tannerella sp.]|jgi:predicted nucleotidyltransferase component of viral defense system|nr:nucleotidyl transferase AbiEii/AbiGii toxin family protein [Tannerella sp.]